MLHCYELLLRLNPFSTILWGGVDNNNMLLFSSAMNMLSISYTCITIRSSFTPTTIGICAINVRILELLKRSTYCSVREFVCSAINNCLWRPPRAKKYTNFNSVLNKLCCHDICLAKSRRPWWSETKNALLPRQSVISSLNINAEFFRI